VIPGPRLLGGGRPAHDVALLQDEDIQAGLGKVRCAREAIVASPDDDDVAFEHAHGSARVPGARCPPQRRTRTTLGNRTRVRARPLDVNSVQRRALVNATVAAVAVFAIGSAVVFATSGSTEEASPATLARPRSASPPPPCTPTWDVVRSANRSEEPTTLLGVTASRASEAWAVGGIGQDPDAPTAVAIQRWDGTSGRRSRRRAPAAS
jgi:hypothetical protein